METVMKRLLWRNVLLLGARAGTGAIKVNENYHSWQVAALPNSDTFTVSGLSCTIHHFWSIISSSQLIAIILWKFLWNNSFKAVKETKDIPIFLNFKNTEFLLRIQKKQFWGYFDRMMLMMVNLWKDSLRPQI